MVEPPRDPREPVEDETVVVPPRAPAPGEPVVVDDWGPESEVFVEETQTETVPPRRPFPQIWPWLLALLLLVIGGLAAAYFLSRDDGKATATTATVATTAVPVLIGLRQPSAEERVRAAGFEPIVERKASAKPQGVVFAQDPAPGTSLERGKTVRLTVSNGPPKETVPDVVGQPAAEAVADLKAAGLDSRQVEAFGKGEKGTVLKQDPVGGAKLKRGAVVTLTVSKGPQPVTVPDVVGTTSSEATATLRGAGLQVNLVPVPSNQPSGTVVAQSPASGAQAPKGSTVRLNVAQRAGGTTTSATTTTTGTAPATTTAAAQPRPATVPDVVGQELAKAAQAFAEQGLKAAVQYVPSNEAAGSVVAQAQPAGTQRQRGDTVQLNVSIGAQPAADTAVPDVVGSRQVEARQALVQAGFEVLALDLKTGQVRNESPVVSQTPAGGATIPRGSLVILYVGS